MKHTRLITLIAPLLITGFTAVTAYAQDDVGWDPANDTDGSQPTDAGGGSEPGDAAKVEWIEPQINGTAAADRTVTTGNSYSAIPKVSGLNVDYYSYKIMIGKIEGSYKPTNAEACTDVQNNVGADSDTSTYGAAVATGGATAQLTAAQETRPRISDTVTRANLGQYKYHLVAFLFRSPKTTAFPNDPCHNAIYLVRRISFSSDSGGSTGGGSTTVPAPNGEISVNNSPFGSSSGSGGSSGSVGGSSGSRSDTVDALSIQQLQSNPAAALCMSLSITLPGNKGVIDLNQAGVLGLCNTRPLLMNAINILTILAGIFFVISVIYSGIMLVQASSDDVAAKAKRNLVWSAVGAVVVMLANWIVPYIIYVLSSATK